MIRQLMAIQQQTVALVLRHQVDHRLPAVAGFAVDMFKQQQRGGPAAVKQFAIGRLGIQRILSH